MSCAFQVSVLFLQAGDGARSVTYMFLRRLRYSEALCDSHVARSVVARARSSSRSFKLIMKKICALSRGFGIYGAGRFAYKMEFSRSSDKEF